MSLWVCVFLNFFLSFSQDLQSPYLSAHNSLAVISFFCQSHTSSPFLPELFITCIYHEVPLNRENRDSSRDKSSSSPLSFTHPDLFCITHYRASYVSWICKCLQMCASALALKEASVFFPFLKLIADSLFAVDSKRKAWHSFKESAALLKFSPFFKRLSSVMTEWICFLVMAAIVKHWGYFQLSHPVSQNPQTLVRFLFRNFKASKL